MLTPLEPTPVGTVFGDVAIPECTLGRTDDGLNLGGLGNTVTYLLCKRSSCKEDEIKLCESVDATRSVDDVFKDGRREEASRWFSDLKQAR